MFASEVEWLQASIRPSVCGTGKKRKKETMSERHVVALMMRLLGGLLFVTCRTQQLSPVLPNFPELLQAGDARRKLAHSELLRSPI